MRMYRTAVGGGNAAIAPPCRNAVKKKAAAMAAKKRLRRGALFLFLAALDGKVFQREAQELADARVLLLRVPFQH